MIEKMKMVCVVSSISRKDEMLDGLRTLGLLHLAEKKSPARAVAERFTTFRYYCIVPVHAQGGLTVTI